MRAAGIAISVLSHIVLVALALFGTPKLFDMPSIASIEVDLVRPEEVDPPKEKPKDDKPAPWEPLPQKAESMPEAAAPQPQPKPPEVNQQSALGPQTAPPKPEARPPLSIFDPANIPALMDIPNAPDKGFDAEATAIANLADDEKAAFKAHLKKCWKLPAGMSPAQTTRVVLRIYLRRDGALAGEPVLIEAPASREGPLLLQAATRSLKDCQPYAFLPAAKYREWRVLDLSFSPREMAGG